ncbi:ABC transporter permease [Haloarculaceae archaeon H-GB2-1]|nr:ABC transporter permease [Haloarculaceae archaeon H-GB1-1]MEA5385789.1 ABC transporter permease [Haloarculaceae archaeon H-GB11]MEA5407291.1 ABC transporter permease [Haloarculaceae archaeon H-GB2-1]
MISRRFLLKRLLLLVPVLFGVATFVFAMLHLAPGDPARLIAGRRAPDAFVQQVRTELGLNRPVYVQYGEFLLDVVRFDFGKSYQIQKGAPVSEILEARFPVTLELAVLGQLTGIALGIPLGVLSAVKQDSLTDHLTRIGALTGISVPIFWSGPILIMVFGVMLGWLPTFGRIATTYTYESVTHMILIDTLLSGNPAAFVSAARHMLLPVLVIGIYSMALISRMMRSSMLEVIRQDYMRTARAKGQGANITVMKHGFQNALIPVITVIGIQFGTLLGGAILTETVFSINGVGTLLVEAINNSDYPVVQGTVLLFALLFTLVNLGVDVTYSYLDPRIEQ